MPPRNKRRMPVTVLVPVQAPLLLWLLRQPCQAPSKPERGLMPQRWQVLPCRRTVPLACSCRWGGMRLGISGHCL